MVKVDSGSDKKRKKTSTSESTTSPQKLDKNEVYQNAIEFEESDARKRSSEEDTKLFREKCDDLKKLLLEVSSLKEENTEEAKRKIAEKRIQGSLIIVVLKKLNRLDKIRLSSGRDSLNKEKNIVDSNRLQLQNLIYEADHLKKEIQKCHQFKSEDEDINLIPLPEFYELAPESVSRPDETKNNEHALRLARLEFELEQRKEYAKKCKELMESKEKVAQDIISQKEKLDSLAPRLQDLLKASRPIQEILGMEYEKNWEIQKQVRLLPLPLYMVYTNICAYASVADKLVTCTIEGDEEEARQLDEDNKRKANEQAVDENNEDSDENEENEFDEPVQKNRHKRRTSKALLLNGKREELFKHHPLSVTFNINTKSKEEETLSITLIYIPALGFVTVQCKLNFDSQSVAAGDIITQDRILNSLYLNDFGLESPNPKTKYQLEAVALDPNDLIKLLDEKKLGKPYKWAQRLCGIKFNEKLTPDQSYELCQDTVPELIKQIRSRLQARMKLYYQIQSLEVGKVAPSGAIKISSILQQFVSLSFAEYSSVGYTHKFIDDGLVSANDLFYRAVLTRGSAKLEAYIAVPSDFPNEFPLFAISLDWNDNKLNSENNSNVRYMEYYINTFTTKKIDNVLQQQLQKTMTSLDIYLETESCLHDPPEFQQEKIFYRSFKGRSRTRPYKSFTTGSKTFFKQV